MLCAGMVAKGWGAQGVAASTQESLSAAGYGVSGGVGNVEEVHACLR